MNTLGAIPKYLSRWDKLKHRVFDGDPLHKDLELFNDGKIVVFFAPFGSDFNLRAFKKIKILMVGLTPGLTQVRAKADEWFTNSKEQDDDSVSFSGSMRINLVSMLDEIGIPQALGIPSSADLFLSRGAHLADSTSLLRYPVFKRGQNYTGHGPGVDSHTFLTKMVDEIFKPFVDELPSDSLIVPMGKAVEAQIRRLAAIEPRLEAQSLLGFPHPSGANGSRKATFNSNRARLIKQVREILN